MTEPLTVFLYIVAVIAGFGVGIGLAIGGGMLAFSVCEWLSELTLDEPKPVIPEKRSKEDV